MRKENNLERHYIEPNSFLRFNFDNVSYFNIFRIFCALSVILLHIDMFPGQTALYNNCGFLEFIRNGLAPVAFFFLLSGFLFNKLYLKKFANNEVTGKQYFKNKFIKFFPFMFLTTTVFFILSLIATYGLNMNIARGSVRFVDWIFGVLMGGQEIFYGNYTCLNAAMWYLNILIFVYIVAYLFVLLYKKKPYKFIFLIPMFLGLGMGYLEKSYPFCNWLFGRGLYNFFLGFFTYELFNRLTRLKTKGVIITKSISAILIFFYLFSYFYIGKVKHSPMFSEYETDFGVTNFLFYIPLMLLLNCNLSNKIATFSPVKFICNLTFDIYIWHQISFAVIEIIIRSNNLTPKNNVGFFFIILGSVIALALVSNIFIDKKVRNKTKELVYIFE